MYKRENRLFSIEEIEDLWHQSKQAIKDKYDKPPYIEVEGHKLRINSVRYDNFFEHGTTCVECGLEGEYFALETNIDRRGNVIENGWHFNLYGHDSNGREVMLTHDHIIPKSLGGKDMLSNQQTMCEPCNLKKGNLFIGTMKDGIPSGATIR